MNPVSEPGKSEEKSNETLGFLRFLMGIYRGIEKKWDCLWFLNDKPDDKPLVP